jgi:hypothetical protein
VIAFQCSSCGQSFEVGDSLAGKKGRCKNCGQIFTIPVLAPKAPRSVQRTPAKQSRNAGPGSRAKQPAAFNPFEDQDMLPAAGPAEVAEPVLRRTTPGRSRPAARQGPFLPVLRGATVGFFLVFFALAAPSVSLERRFVPGGRLPDRPFGTIPTDLGPAASALACAKMVAQLSVVLTAVLALVSFVGTTQSYLRGNRAAFHGGSPWLNRGWYMCGLLTAAYLAFLSARFGPAITISHANARARPHRLPPSWPAGKPIDVDAALTDLNSDNRGTRLMALGRLQGAQVEPSRQAEVVKLLEPLVISEDLGDRDNAVTALGVWGTHESVPLLLNALNDYASNKWSRVHLFTALQRIKDPSCAETVAARLTDRDDMHQAANVLFLLGEAGERATWKYLDHPDVAVSRTAFGVIQAIGTDASIPAVRNVLKGPDKNLAKTTMARATLEILGASE